MRDIVENIKNDESQRKNRFIPNVAFSEIGGLGDIIKTIREIIELPIKQPQLFEHLGIKPHKGILLYGPPGCGKTLIAKAIATEINARFQDIKGPELFNKYIGQSEENLRNIFAEARNLAPSIIFFDEIDSIAQERSGESSVRYESQFVNQLLTLMDGMEEYSNARIIAFTNRPELLDEAVLRPGRFDYHIEIKKPNLEGCREILKICTAKMPISNKFDLDIFTRELAACTGADIRFISTEAAYNCIRRNIELNNIVLNEFHFDIQNFIVSNEDFFWALAELKNGNNNDYYTRKAGES
jgi:SpoVK/Ycf46/Vps4 family AAA+-type ATPase